MANSTTLEALIVDYKALGPTLNTANTTLKTARENKRTADAAFAALTGASTNLQIGDAIKAQQTADADVELAELNARAVQAERASLEAQARALINAGGG